ncbi:hypothetical protein Z517_03099 [Fonsecaea pedrosoi CBS 271.37]|uniref:Unplaced genomic scaffold supercont1.2, whole genome shotgun sequence n=1 Tax=Fonsecaea pedrosoi CBS 271.37 TaxID=1442368 RepID=A0A0D2GSA3_9EURO|nr:uncharacterized protein Z517_03099 [Fonsecaea pedrosoi CBS 271.37]KIW83853.1 hypothetical protein Z517_03099 [Fonsecaea pedrosoi CBS 271.37]
MSSGDVEGGPLPTSLHQGAMREGLQDHLPPPPVVQYALQGGSGGDERTIPSPFGNATTAEFLEAQHFNFSANYFGDTWSNVNQFSELNVSDQDVNGFQMMDMPSFLGFQQGGGLFNLDYLP